MVRAMTNYLCKYVVPPIDIYILICQFRRYICKRRDAITQITGNGNQPRLIIYHAMVMYQYKQQLINLMM